MGVSADTFAALGGFAEKNGITFPLLSDWSDFKTMDSVGVKRDGANLAMRKTLIFDAEGVVKAIVDDERDMDAHPAGALAAVKELAG
jgi:peroxiredoxin (alkyl hydroperoxide reductase subunit C)